MNQAALRTDRLSPVSRCLLAEHYWLHGKTTLAEHLLRFACDLSPAAEPHLILGCFLLSERQIEEAIATLQLAWEKAKASRNRSVQAECCLLLARAYHRTGNASLEYQFAQLAMSASLESDDALESPLPHPRVTRALLTRMQQSAMTVCREGEWERGIELLERASRIVESLNECGRAQMQRSAAGRLRRSLELLTSSPLWN